MRRKIIKLRTKASRRDARDINRKHIEDAEFIEDLMLILFDLLARPPAFLSALRTELQRHGPRRAPWRPRSGH